MTRAGLAVGVFRVLFSVSLFPSVRATFSRLLGVWCFFGLSFLLCTFRIFSIFLLSFVVKR